MAVDHPSLIHDDFFQLPTVVVVVPLNVAIDLFDNDKANGQVFDHIH